MPLLAELITFLLGIAIKIALLRS